MSFRIKLGFRDLSVTEFIMKTSHITTMMTGNANFVTPVPALADIEMVRDELVALANEAMNRDKLKIAMRNAKRVELENMLRMLSGYVISVSNGDKDVILSSGFDVVERGEPIGMLQPVSDLKTDLENGFPGMIKLTWKGVHGASSYIVERTTGDPADPATEWQEVGHTQRTRFYAEGLTPGTAYSFRVIPVGAAGLGGVSPAVTRIAA